MRPRSVTIAAVTKAGENKVRRTPKKGPIWGWRKMFTLGDYIENQETFEGVQKKNSCKLK